MTKNQQINNVFILKMLSLIIYIIFLVKVIIFKYPLDMTLNMIQNNSQIPLYLKINNANFIPFKSIMNYCSGNFALKLVLANLLGNIVIFIPLGIFIPIIFNKRKLSAIIIYAFSLSFTFEVVQLITSIGTFDVDDIILNVLGTIIGYILYRLFNK